MTGADDSNRGLPRFLRDVRRRLRVLLPARVSSAAKTLVLGWGQLTASRRVLPTFLVIGAQRGGTTSLFRALSDHPDVFRPTVSKGVGYFDLEYARGPRWYRGHFPLASTVRRRAGERGRCFESSGYYSVHPLAAARIAADLPHVKVVLMVRDPVERAYSAWKHERRRGFEDLEFSEALRREDARLAGELDRIISRPGYASFEHRHHAYRGRGRYAEQVGRFVDALGSDQVFVLDADHFFADPRPELDALFDWLGLRRVPVDVGRWNATDAGPLDATLRAELRTSFEDSDAELASLTGRAPSWRPTDADRRLNPGSR